MRAAAPIAEAWPWRRAALWLACLAPLFYLLYGAANLLAERRAFVPSIAFGWERDIPFLPWTIIPYWSVNLFYAVSLFVCTTKSEVDTLGRRLLTALLIAVACFILFPLRFSFARPPTGGGVSGFLFDALMSFDKPYNQAPSLHIAFLVILWVHYWRHIPGWAHWALHGWFALIGLSVLTTYQHHFFDIPTGALLGLLCLWLWPDKRGESSGPASGKRMKLAVFYAGGALVLAAIGILVGGWALWLCYPAVSLALVAANYAYFGPAGFQKSPDGTISLAARLLFAPYRLGAFVNSRIWTRADPAPVEVCEGVYLGRIPSRFDRDSATFAAIVDLTAEFPSPRGGWCIHAVPMLDLVATPPAVLAQATQAIDAAAGHGPILVCCALGYSRSAASVAAWLLASGRADTAEQAIGMVRAARPRIVIGPNASRAISAAGRGMLANG